MGEVIPLELAFTAASPEAYQISLASYDRSGRMSAERFLLEPQTGTSDPLQLYFHSLHGFLGGGLFSVKFLSTAPTTIRLELNEWVRFDQPGTYRLTVVSRRVRDTRAGVDPRKAETELTSNPVELRIRVADAAWQQAQLKSILAALDGSPRRAGSPGDDPRQSARKALRYLGSEEAAREMARRLRGEDSQADFNCMFGLVGSPQRAAGLEEMEKLLENPDFPISDFFLTTMSILPLQPKGPNDSMAKERDENLAALRTKLVAALAKKQGKALAVSLDTAMSNCGPTLAPEHRDKLIPQLIGLFSALAVEKQTAWLQYRWQEVNDPRWLPVLRALAVHYEDFPELRTVPAYQSLQLSAAALTRWYELDPSEARDAVMREITRPKPRYNATVLGVLPDQTLPDVERAIAEHFLATDNYEIEGNLASLLFRYADRAVLPGVLEKVERQLGQWACEPQDQALAYVLKVDPEVAKPLIERAIAARGASSSGCRHMLLTDIGALLYSPVLEELALSSLSDPDPQVAGNAAGFLGQYGSAACERVLWDRYEAWSREWSGRAEELRFVAARANPHVWDANLGQSLARALASGTNWLAAESKLRRIEALGIGANIQGDIEQDLRDWSQSAFTITYIETVPPSFNIAQYNSLSLDSLEKKLTQYPAGTKFALSLSGSSPSPQEQKMRAEIFQFADRHGITVRCAP
jgi:hypothetical protein